MGNIDEKLSLVSQVCKTKIYSLNGEAFEDFALGVLKLKYPTLKITKPDGREGDWGTDGVCLEEGIFFQVYGPEYKDKDSNLSSAKKKLERDFERSFEKWQAAGFSVKEMHFVYNDKYSGVYPELLKKLNELKVKFKLGKADLFVSKDLEDIVIKSFLASPGKVQLLLNSLVLNMEEVDLDNFNSIKPIYQVCEYILKRNKNHGFQYLNNDPALADLEKIDKNKLNSIIKSYILTSLDQVDLVNEFFNSNSEFISEEIRKYIVRVYSSLAKDYVDKNQVFIKLLEELSNDWQGYNKCLNEALFILVSYYFQLCDIFER